MEPGASAISVSLPALAETEVDAGSVSPDAEAAGGSDALAAAGAAVTPPLEKSTTAGPGHVNFLVSLRLTLKVS